MRIRTALLLLTLASTAMAQNKTRDQLVRDDRAKVTSEGFWIYNDLDAARRQAKETGKPLLVVLRCIPCHECVKLDDELVDRDPVIRPLLEQYVCVRLVSTNGLDLSLFQYDTDQSFAVFMLNADNTIYGRFGTRSHRTEWIGDVSLAGLAEALRGGLKLHAAYPENRHALAGKRGPKPQFPSPEQIPGLREKYTATLNYEGDVARSCIHCHQIGDALRDWHRGRAEPIPESLLFPYPHPKTVGLILDPQHRAAVRDVVDGSHAAEAGFRSGDRIAELNGQPMLSMADVQWVLHNIPPQGGSVQAIVSRGDERHELTVRLPDGWRRAGDLSWRVSSWGLRRMVTGGLKLAALDDAEKRQRNLSPDAMALVVEHVGQYGPHAAAKKAGFRKGDVLIEYDGRTDLVTDTALLAWGATQTRPGQEVSVVVLRDGRKVRLTLPMQS